MRTVEVNKTIYARIDQRRKATVKGSHDNCHRGEGTVSTVEDRSRIATCANNSTYRRLCSDLGMPCRFPIPTRSGQQAQEMDLYVFYPDLGLGQWKGPDTRSDAPNRTSERRPRWHCEMVQEGMILTVGKTAGSPRRPVSDRSGSDEACRTVSGPRRGLPGRILRQIEPETSRKNTASSGCGSQEGG